MKLKDFQKRFISNGFNMEGINDLLSRKENPNILQIKIDVSQNTNKNSTIAMVILHIDVDKIYPYTTYEDRGIHTIINGNSISLIREI